MADNIAWDNASKLRKYFIVANCYYTTRWDMRTNYLQGSHSNW